MTSLSAVRDAVKATLGAAFTGVHLYDFVPDAPSLPAVAVVPVLADFDAAFNRGIDTWEYELIVLTSRSSDRAGQDKLDQLVTGAGGLSIRQAIFNNQSLGGVVDSAHVAGLTSYLPTVTAAGVDIYAARLRLVVMTSGTS